MSLEGAAMVNCADLAKVAYPAKRSPWRDGSGRRHAVTVAAPAWGPPVGCAGARDGWLAIRAGLRPNGRRGTVSGC